MPSVISQKRNFNPKIFLATIGAGRRRVSAIKKTTIYAQGSAQIRNAAGEFAKPSTKSIRSVALEMESRMAADFRVSLTNAPGKESYPIVSFTWFYVAVHLQDLQRRLAVKEYLSWLYVSGQEIAQGQGYATLPPSVLQKVRARVVALR